MEPTCETCVNWVETASYPLLTEIIDNCWKHCKKKRKVVTNNGKIEELWYTHIHSSCKYHEGPQLSLKFIT